LCLQPVQKAIYGDQAQLPVLRFWRLCWPVQLLVLALWPAFAKRTSVKSKFIVVLLLALSIVIMALLFFYREIPRGPEQAGEVPKDATTFDWRLAQRTSWWGKPLDPKDFWKGKTIWLDTQTKLEARRHGRFYPPMPFEDTNFAFRSDKDDAFAPTSIEGGNIAFHDTDKENAFWNRFELTHPRPPEELERKQNELATDILEGRGSNLTPKDIASVDNFIRSRTISQNFPAELVTDDALYWGYVSYQRQEYQNLIKSRQASKSFAVEHFLGELFVDAKLITDPLTNDQIKAANAWKIAYLQRLQNEKVDQSYINAYIKAWNLSPEQVFNSKN
jgi:hypothetical protein